METATEYKYRKAKEHVECIRGFYNHLMVYIIVIGVLGYLNYATTSFLWVIFPALGWGIGLLAHGIQAFGYFPFLGKDWEERKIKEFMERNDY